MWIIVAIIIILAISCYCSFSKTVDNTVENFEENKWWAIGMLANMHNKKNEKK